MNMAGKGPEMLVTLTTDYGKVLDGMHRTKIRGQTHLATAIQIAGVRRLPCISISTRTLSVVFQSSDSATSPPPQAFLSANKYPPFHKQLALKHRQNKSQRQRIIVFTCSPIGEDPKELVKLAKKMKKNNVAVDFVAFGDLESTTTAKLEAFHENIRGSASGEGGSHLEIVHPGPSLLSDHLLSTPILAGEGGGAAAGMGRGGAGSGGADGVDGADLGGGAGAGGDGVGGSGGAGGFEFGVDPSTDPELALALRMSMEEEKARLEREKKAREDKEKLEGIPEEGKGEKEPLLAGEESSAAGGEAKGDEERGASGDDSKEEKKKDGGGDSMDTS